MGAFETFNGLDGLLLVFLLVALPLYQLQASLRGQRSRASSTGERFRRSLAILGAPCLILAIDWVTAGRPAAALGLAFPSPAPGWIGLAIAGVLISVVVITGALRRNRLDPGKAAAERDAMEAAGLLIGGRGELALYVLLMGLIALSGEVLFRGFLLWAFRPLVGLVGAVILAALAYGAAHGFQDWKGALRSTLSAFVFTIAYAMTRSLWWLMLVHGFAGVFGGWSGYRLVRRERAQAADRRSAEIAI
jgi:membrane protease YdiL (CAAX protease family)